MGTMLSVLGTVIVKILLFLLFFVLFLIVLICCVLWVPIRYRADGCYGEEKSLQGKASWFVFLLQLQLHYEEELEVSLRLFGVDVIALLKKRAQRKAAKKSKKRKNTAQTKTIQRTKKAAADPKDIKQQKEELSMAEHSDIRQEDRTEKQEKSSEEEIPAKENAAKCRKTIKEAHKKVDERKKTKRASVKKTIKNWFQSIKNMLSAIRKRIRQAGKLKELLQDDNTKAFVCILKDNVIHLWRKLKPKKLEAKLCFGTGQPDTTGEILALLAVFYAYYGSNVTIIPDFEQARLEGWFKMKGRISVWSVLIVLIKVFMSKEWNQFRKDTSRWKEAF